MLYKIMVSQVLVYESTWTLRSTCLALFRRVITNDNCNSEPQLGKRYLVCYVFVSVENT